MIETTCNCGAPIQKSEAEINLAFACPHCEAPIYPVSAESLPDGAGAGDFDTRLVIIRGPARIGEQILLGGCHDISIGKFPDCPILLPGERVSRRHCKLVRLDFGPSRWKIVDEQSTNGVKLNDEKVPEAELQHNDIVKIGEYLFRFQTDSGTLLNMPPGAGLIHDAASSADDIADLLPPPSSPPSHHRTGGGLGASPPSLQRQTAPIRAIPIGGPTCPSCNQPLSVGAKICTDCGIYIDTGRPLVMSKGFDEDDFAIRADTWIRVVSWIVPSGLFPIASEAFATRKPTATWVIFAVTVLASLLFFVAYQSRDRNPQIVNLMHWSGDREALDEKIDERVQAVRTEIRKQSDRLGVALDEEQVDEILDEVLVEARAELAANVPREAEFRWYQLLTHAVLHDPSGAASMLLHLGGNMLFLLVFGLRVNELIGNVRMAIIYPILAVLAATTHALASDGALGALLGASGAVMGLAGMYVVLFPLQKVHMAIWARWFLCFIPLVLFLGIKVSYKTFLMRGFWLLLLLIVINDVLPTLFEWHTGVAHWAHLGGFAAGATIAVILLVTRQVSAYGSDALSVLLGRRAWALVGRPSSRKIEVEPPVRGVSLSFPQ